MASTVHRRSYRTLRALNAGFGSSFIGIGAARDGSSYALAMAGGDLRTFSGPATAPPAATPPPPLPSPTPPLTTPTPAPSPANRLDPGQRLGSGGYLAAGGYVLLMQGDGNLVLIAPGNRPTWSSRTGGNPGSVLVMQADGNAVVYAPGNRPVWWTAGK